MAFSFASGLAHLVHFLFQVGDARGNLLLQQRKEQIFLAVEVGVKRAAGISGIGGDFFQLRGLKSVARKNFLRRLEQCERVISVRSWWRDGAARSCSTRLRPVIEDFLLPGYSFLRPIPCGLHLTDLVKFNTCMYVLDTPWND